MANIQSEIVQMNINGVSAEGYLSKPGNLDSEAPGIVVIQEWWGLDDHIKSITERFAEQGFIALAPDLFHGSVTTEPDEAMKLTQAMDERITSTVPELEKALNDNGIVNEIIIYPNVDHAFFNDTNIPVYNKEAAESAWSKTLSFFSANLR